MNPQAASEATPAEFVAFLEVRRDFVTARWIEAVRRNPAIPTANALDDRELADHMPKLFRDLVAALNGDPPAAAALARDAETHGNHRWEQHYSLAEVLIELEMVRCFLLEDVLDTFEDAHPDFTRVQRRRVRQHILQFCEDMAAGSTRRYVERSEDRLGHLHAQLLQIDRTLSEQRRLALDSAQMGWWHVDAATGILHMDDRFLAIFDVHQHTDAYAHVLQRIHPDDRVAVDAAVQAAMDPQRAEPYDMKYRVIRGDGSLRWIVARGKASFAGEGADRRALSMAGTVLDITESKLAHDALSVSEQKYRSLFDSIDMAFCVLEVIWDADDQPVDYRFVEVNRAMEQHTGWKDPVGRTARELIPGLEDHWPRIYGQVARTGEPVRFVEGAVGMGRVFDVHASRVGSAENPQVGVIFQDITERRQTEAQLASLSEQRRLALDSAQLGWWHLDLESGQVEWDERAQRFYDAPSRFPVVGEALKLVLPEDLANRQRAFAAAIRPVDPRFYLVEYRVRHQDGNLHWLQIKGQATFTGEGAARRAVSMDGTIADVTEAKTIQRALQESETKFRQLADAMPQIVWAARPDGVLDYTNRRLYEYIQRAEPEINVADWGQWVHPEDLPGAAAVWAGCVATGDPYSTEFRLRRADDTYRWFLVRALPVRGEDGTIIRWYGTCTDINAQRGLLEQNAQLLTSERTARAEAERNGRMKDEFLATLSHELRTPLNAILGWTQVLRGEPGNSEDLESGLATIERNARAQNQIIEDLLDMSRIISGKVRLDVQRIDLAQVVAGAVETVRPAAEAKGIRLQPVIDPYASAISGDPNRLQQVFWNLLTNAVKFTPKNGRIQIVLERINSHLEVRITDSGEGIAPDFLPYVFDRFRQQDASTTRRHGGLGLGLAIVKQLVELHGGTVGVHSDGPGQGTMFRVELPLAVVQLPTEPDEPERRHPAGGESPALAAETAGIDLSGVRVLVVDDEADARALVRRLLTDRGAEVRMAGSAAEALGLFQTEAPNVLVSDIGMPNQDGYALIRQVRALPAAQGGNVPALALTAYARSEDRLKVVMAGFQMHLAKPVEAVELLVLVANLAGRTGGAR